jgi:hypothetical protein
MRHLSGPPFALRIWPTQALSRIGVFHHSDLVPDEAPHIQFVLQNSRTPVSRAIHGGGVPCATARWRHPLIIQAVRDRQRALALLALAVAEDGDVVVIAEAAHAPGAIDEAVLASSALMIVRELVRCRLPDVDAGVAGEMLSRDLGHRRSPRLPPCKRRRDLAQQHQMCTCLALCSSANLVKTSCRASCTLCPDSGHKTGILASRHVAVGTTTAREQELLGPFIGRP